jgi:parvulin-like peptidyl-prolyl isomerase
MKRIVSAVIVSLWAYGLMGLWGFGTVAPSLCDVVDCVMAVVNGEPITLSTVEDAMNAIWTDPQTLPKSRQEALEKLIDHKLKLQEARSLGVIWSEESLSHEVAKVASRFASPKQFSEALLRRGITQEDLEESLIEEIMIREMVSRKFRGFVELTEIEAADFFKRHRDEFMVPETLHFDQIFFQLAGEDDPRSDKERVRKKAEELLNKLRNGADLSEYANEIAGASSSTPKGPVDYTIVEHRYVAVDQVSIPVVAAAVSRLKIGEISDLVETSAGYFIIKLNDRRPSRRATFDEVKEHLIQRKADAELEDWLKRQRKLADIRVKS